jgi:hypothetical protein
MEKGELVEKEGCERKGGETRGMGKREGRERLTNAPIGSTVAMTSIHIRSRFSSVRSSLAFLPFLRVLILLSLPMETLVQVCSAEMERKS